MRADFSLDGQVALVTGASSGLGRAFAGFLNNAGASVAIAARRADKCMKVAEEIGSNTLAVSMDVTNQESIESAISKIETELGLVTLLVNNAGIVNNNPVIDTSPEDWRQVIDTNLTGYFLMTQAVSRRLIAAKKSGRIVNVSSILGVIPSGQVHAYAASKAGINQLTRTSARELARYNISVNAIAPGYIETNLNRDFLTGSAGGRILERIAQRRFGQLEDLEGVLLLLTAPAGGYMTGEVVTIDGGLSLSGM
ncbi:MAG: 2-deoxy-D-gluconate 3-dehydrogenase [Pelagibacteraceae bacterium]|nr:2-deoxy-D-gluconate 3-dehydrogenase [Pelagibacteraceae bacterium]PPR10874.1 MAG: 3-oxoacyl-[acyl-carrier-protein] reductase FabG [Alphaproteobacteria bacterium MarineAlpha11_Bin1]|tara:strand:+ start:20821 stop:21579 length:759 start_codon:yes stop_codon:yes gene_type:complete